jgi:hypothetical protein
LERGFSPSPVRFEIQSAAPWQPHIKHETAGNIWELSVQEFFGRTEYLSLQADGSEKALQRLAHGRVVVDDENDRLRLGPLCLHAARNSQVGKTT